MAKYRQPTENALPGYEMTEQEAKYTSMTNDPVGKLVWRLALPSIGSMLISAVYNLVDTIFVGRLDTQSTAALGIVFCYMAIIQAVSFFFGHGSGNFISRALGHKDVEGASRMAAHGFFMAIIIGSMIALTCFVFMEPVLRFFGSTSTIMPKAKEYMRWILVGTPFIVGCFVMNNQMRFQGNSLLALIGISSGAILNIILDPILIFWFGLGISGAGIATAVSQAVSFFIMFSMIGRSGGLKLRVAKFLHPTGDQVREVFAGGLPSLARQGLNSIATVCLNQCAASFGDSAVAAFSVAGRIMMVANAIVIGIGQGYQPVCGFNYGANLYGRVLKAFSYTVKVSTLYCFCYAVLGLVFAPEIIRFFRAEDIQLVQYGSELLRYQCLAFTLQGLSMPAGMHFQTTNKTVPAVLIAIARQGFFFFPALYLGMHLGGLRGVMLSQPIADVCTFAMTVPIVIAHTIKLRSCHTPKSGGELPPAD